MLGRKSWALALVTCLVANPVSVAFADSDAVAKAQQAADEALKAYQAGEYAKAISLYLESYKLAASAETLYNIASIYEKKLHERDLAIEYYRRCSASSDASAELVGKATAHIAALTKEKEAEGAPKSAPATSSAPAAPAPAKPESDGSTMRTVGWITAGAGLASIGIGVFFGLSAKSKHADATSAGCANGLCPSAAGVDSERSANSAARISTIGFVAGGVLAAGGLALVLLAPSTKLGTPNAPVTGAIKLTPLVDRGGGGFTLSTLF